MGAAKPPALCAYCPACGGPAVPLSAAGTYRVHRCANSRAVATDAAIARWVAWETDCARMSSDRASDRLARAQAELSGAEEGNRIARARLAAITAIAAARGITTKEDR